MYEHAHGREWESASACQVLMIVHESLKEKAIQFVDTLEHDELSVLKNLKFD